MATSRKPKPRSELHVKAWWKTRRAQVFGQLRLTDAQVAVIAGILAALTLALVVVRSYFQDTTANAKLLNDMHYDRGNHSGRGSMHADNLKQIGLAFMNYESSNTAFSPTTILVPTPNGVFATWAFQSSRSAFARATLFMEQGAFYNAINCDTSLDGTGNGTTNTCDGDWYVRSVNWIATAVTAVSKTEANGPSGNTCWSNGGVYYSGFTTALTSNSTVAGTTRYIGAPNAGQAAPMDWDWVHENDGGPTYIAPAATSFHPGGVNVDFADGSVHFPKETVSTVI